MKLSQLLYISDAKTAISSDGIERIVDKCQKNNRHCDVTGLLLYSAGHFIQLLEGESATLANLFVKISHDPRHHNVERLHFANCNQRLFPKWQMGLLNIDGLNELDRFRLLAMVNRLKRSPDSATILSVFRDFRTQLPAKIDAGERAAAAKRKTEAELGAHSNL